MRLLYVLFRNLIDLIKIMKSKDDNGEDQQFLHNKYRLPSIHRKKTESCDIDFRRVRTYASQQKSSTDVKKQLKDQQLLRKLKLISLIKSDYKSLKVFAPSQNYAPYKRSGRSQIKKAAKAKYNQKLKQKYKQSITDQIKTPSRGYGKDGLIIYKLNLRENDSQMSKASQYYRYYSKQHNFITSVPTASIGRVNCQKFPSISSRVKTQPLNCQDISKQKQKIEPNDLLLSINLQQQVQQLQDQVKCEKKNKNIGKQKYQLKKSVQYTRKLANNQALFKGTIKGWTKYDKMNEYFGIQ